MTPHPVASIFPAMSEDEYVALKGDIAANGQREAIWTWRGFIVDGRHRDRACNELGIATKSIEWEGEEAGLLAFVVSLNLHRRHLNESQRAFIAAKISTQEHGQRADWQIKKIDRSKDLSTIPIPEAAAMLNVSEKTARRARVVMREGSPEDIAAIEQGKARVTPIATRLRQQTAARNAPDNGVRKRRHPLLAKSHHPKPNQEIQRVTDMLAGICDVLTKLEVDKLDRRKVTTWIVGLKGSAAVLTRTARRIANVKA